MKDQSHPIHYAVSHINKLMNTAYIFCYGHRSNNSHTDTLFWRAENTASKSLHYDFLVITPHKMDTPAINCMEITHPDGLSLSLTLIVHTLEEVTQGIKENNRFYHTVVNRAEKVYANTESLPAELQTPFNQKADEALTLSHSYTFYENLEVYSQMIYTIEKPHLSVPLICEMLKQACLLLIYVRMGYEPENYTLADLLNLCNSIDRRCENIIPRITEADRYHYQLLIQGYWKGKYGIDREPITVYLHKTCDDFTALATEICEAQLKAIESSASTVPQHTSRP